MNGQAPSSVHHSQQRRATCNEQRESFSSICRHAACRPMSCMSSRQWCASHVRCRHGHVQAMAIAACSLPSLLKWPVCVCARLFARGNVGGPTPSCLKEPAKEEGQPRGIRRRGRKFRSAEETRYISLRDGSTGAVFVSERTTSLVQTPPRKSKGERYGSPPFPAPTPKAA